MPQPRYRALLRFCELDGGEELTGAGGRRSDHRRYRKVLPDGTILRTKVSHGSGRIGDPGLWQRIWRYQLGLESEDEFWAVLRTRKAAPRGTPAPARPPGPTIPAWIVAGLLRAGLGEDEIRRLRPDEARRRLDEMWSRPGA